MKLRSVGLDQLQIGDERSFRHVALYADLKETLRRDGYRFRVPERDSPSSFDRALFLNLTYWSAREPSDVLASSHIPADVVAHAAWHHVVRLGLGPSAGTVEGLFFGEAIASAFDLYLVGRLLGHAPDSEFIETQVPAMSDAAASAGMSDEAFEALLSGVADDPELAFEQVRELLFDAGTSLARAGSIDEAAALLGRLDAHPYAALLHHYELSNWVLYARAYSDVGAAPSAEVLAVDAALRAAPVALDWLTQRWVLAGS